MSYADFYLVQRLSSRKTTNPSRGFDGFFELDYMGSSEFEWGAIPKSLRAIRAAEIVVEPGNVSFQGKDHDVFFVGHPGVGSQAQSMQRWIDGANGRPAFWSKEWTEIPDALTGSVRPYSTTDAWWDISGNFGFALDARTAELLRTAFSTKAVS